MKLDARALAYVGAVLFGGCVLLVGLLNLATPTYGQDFLELLASVYPGYANERTLGGVVIGAGYAFVQGAALGWLVGWLYNRIVQRQHNRKK